MHFEILTEDQSGAHAIEILSRRILGDEHTTRVKSYKGIGHLPKNMKAATDPSKRVLLDQLPGLIRGYRQTFAAAPGSMALVIICDLDQRCLSEFRRDLLRVRDHCGVAPADVLFCIAVEEIEAWLLGDPQAVQIAYPKAKLRVLQSYEPDSVIGTWEKLAEAIYPGGRAALSSKGQPEIGRMKSEWAKKIAPYIDIDSNRSPSFQYFCKKLREALP
jgi:hypothetical protein